MIEAVLDVNVIVSGTLGVEYVDSVPGEILRRWEREDFEVVTSRHIIDGMRRTLAKPYFAARVTPDQALRTIALLLHRARIVPMIDRIVGVAPDDDDDQVLAAAVSGGVRLLVTGDKAFLRLVSYRSVELISPRQFLDLLIAASSPLSP